MPVGLAFLRCIIFLSASASWWSVEVDRPESLTFGYSYTYYTPNIYGVAMICIGIGTSHGVCCQWSDCGGHLTIKSISIVSSSKLRT